MQWVEDTSLTEEKQDNKKKNNSITAEEKVEDQQQNFQHQLFMFLGFLLFRNSTRD